MTKKIILTGGGTAGHVTPNIALLPMLTAHRYDILYIGSYNGIEKKLITAENITYKGISSGKLRRYFDLKNFTDPFRVIKGYFEACSIIRDFKPDIVFSKGGFVSVPVVAAARRHKIPVIIHESDISPGLANKICMRFADKICCSFPETLDYLPKHKAVFTGSPIRSDLTSGSRSNALRITQFDNIKPVLLIIGGSLGSVKINTAVRSELDDLIKLYNIIHICGKGNIDNDLLKTCGYIQYEYAGAELKDLFSLADIVISRAGANTICELLALKKPNILIPLSAAASRGDQILNAASYEKRGFSYVLSEDALSGKSLKVAVSEVYNNRKDYINNMLNAPAVNGSENIIKLILELSL